jgi:hypothetical protein
MKRRSVLSGLGITLFAGGCLESTGSDDPTTDERSADDVPSDSPASNAETPDDRTTEQSRDPFPNIDCPSFRDADVTVCSHTDDHPIPVTLRPDSTSFRVIQGNDTVETLGLTLANASGQIFGFNPHNWRVDRYTDNGWTKVAPDLIAQPWTAVEPNGQYDYELATKQRTSPANGAHQIVVDLTSDVHAVSVVGTWGESADAERVECVAIVDVTVESEESGPSTTTEDDS